MGEILRPTRFQSCRSSITSDSRNEYYSTTSANSQQEE